MKKTRVKELCIKIMAGVLLTLQLLAVMFQNQVQPGEAAVCGDREECYDYEKA